MGGFYVFFVVVVDSWEDAFMATIGCLWEMSASTERGVLRRHGLNRLRWMDRPAGPLLRRYVRAEFQQPVIRSRVRRGRPGSGRAR